MLKSMICQDRLNSLGTLVVEAHLARTVDFYSIIELFAIRKARRVPFLIRLFGINSRIPCKFMPFIV